MKQRRRRPARHKLATSAALALAGVTAALASQGSGCAQEPVTVPVRSLERSGRVSFVCLDKPGVGRVELPLSDCAPVQTETICDYATTTDDAGDQIDGGAAAPGATIPHLYALVTQTTRGEIAVIDTTARENPVLDEDPGVPGANFLPIGAQPVDIVSTPGSTATFVGVAEIGRAGIFALPSSNIRPDSSRSCGQGGGGAGGSGAGGSGGAGGDDAGARIAPELSAWPACALPAAPGQMLLVFDPEVDGQERASCDGAYGEDLPPGPTEVIFQHGDLGLEGYGRQKLLVAMPDLGGVVLIDAQRLLDRNPGSFDPCPVDRWLPLEVVPGDITTPPPPDGPACVNPTADPQPLPGPFESRPAGITYADGRLYVGDLAAPVIHVIDLPTPCEPIERTPLVPTSAERPERVVTTSRVAVSPTLTPDLSRYLYAVDVDDGSLMIFDVSAGSPSRLPLRRTHPEWNPFEPPDRIRFSAPPADLLLLQRDLPKTDPATGVAVSGVRCDPTPIPGANQDSACNKDGPVAKEYRTSASYDSGAGPLNLRGTFAFAALTNGKIAVIDVDDFDGDCRAPSNASTLYGCEENTGARICGRGPTPLGETPLGANELSCNVFVPNAPRSASYVSANSLANGQAPGLTNFPQLLGVNAAPVDIKDATSARMVATLPVESTPGVPPLLVVAGAFASVDGEGKPTTVEVADGGSVVQALDEHTLLMNLEDPRAQVINQNWAVTFEGAIPGFAGKIGSLRIEHAPTDGLVDPNSRFCDAGVLSENAVKEILAAQGELAEAIEAQAPLLADYVQILSDLPPEEDAHWTQVTSCNFASCNTDFGSIDVPTFGRDFVIKEAYQDHVELAFRRIADEPELTLDAVRCCFPGDAAFAVRSGRQWTVNGEITGFIHHVIPAPDGTCRNSCDPALSRRNARVRMVPWDMALPIKDGEPYAFQNPMFRFAIKQGMNPNATKEDEKPVIPERDSFFRFTTSGGFVPLLIALSTDGTSLIAPQGLSFIPSTSELAVTDGALNGLILVSLSSVAVSRQFF